jgi:hypothetical protein
MWINVGTRNKGTSSPYEFFFATTTLLHLRWVRGRLPSPSLSPPDQFHFCLPQIYAPIPSKMFIALVVSPAECDLFTSAFSVGIMRADACSSGIGRLSGHLIQYLYVPWSGNNVADMVSVRFWVFVYELREFQKIPAPLSHHSRRCRLARRVSAFLHCVDPPNRISPFSEMAEMRPPTYHHRPRPRGPSSHLLSYQHAQRMLESKRPRVQMMPLPGSSLLLAP